MQAGDLAAVIVAIVSLAATAVLTVATASLLRSMRELRRVLDTLHDQTEPLVADLRHTIDQAGADLVRVEGILDSAERITHTVDTASQLTYRALTPPLIKTMSLVAGLRRAGRRLRGRGPIDTTAIETTPMPAPAAQAVHPVRPSRRRGERRAGAHPANDRRR